MLSFPNKLTVGSARNLSFDCTGLLDGDTFDPDTSPTISLANYAYASPAQTDDPAHFLVGSFQIQGAILKQKVAVDVAGKYIAILTITTKDGTETFVKRVLFEVED